MKYKTTITYGNTTWLSEKCEAIFQEIKNSIERFVLENSKKPDFIKVVAGLHIFDYIISSGKPYYSVAEESMTISLYTLEIIIDLSWSMGFDDIEINIE